MTRICPSASTRCSFTAWERPNGVKVTVMLEELLALGISEAEYDAWLIRIGDGDQFGSGFVEINPNSKIPALVDHSVTPPQRVFESGAILLYLAEKFGHFLPTDLAGRTETLNWLFWQMGSAPYLGGGFGHFYAYAPEKWEYPINRFAMETKRQLDVLDRHLADRQFMIGDNYTIADMAIWPWYGGSGDGLAIQRRRIPRRRILHQRATLGAGNLRPPRRETWPHGQPHGRRSVKPIARTPRRRRFRDPDAGQAGPSQGVATRARVGIAVGARSMSG